MLKTFGMGSITLKFLQSFYVLSRVTVILDGVLDRRLDLLTTFRS
jgi:hypothetical protein